MTSSRYPFGMTPAYFPDSVKLHRITGFDVLGNDTSYVESEYRCKVTVTPVEAMEGGARAMRDGITLKIASTDIEVGDEIVWKGVQYTVTQISSFADHSDETHYQAVWAVKKRGTN